MCSRACVVFPGWDLEQNKVIRNYHGHLSGVYAVAVHPTVDVIVTGGRDSVARVRADCCRDLKLFA